MSQLHLKPAISSQHTERYLLSHNIEKIVQFGLSSDELTNNEWIQYLIQVKHARSFIKHVLTSHWMRADPDTPTNSNGNIADSIALHCEQIKNLILTRNPQEITARPSQTVHHKMDKLPSALITRCTSFLDHKSCAQFCVINRQVFVSTNSFNNTLIYKIIRYQLSAERLTQREWAQYITRVINNKLMPGSRSRITRLILSHFIKTYKSNQTLNITIDAHLHKINDILSTKKQFVPAKYHHLNQLPQDLINECASFLDFQMCLRLRVTDRQIFVSTKSLKLSHVFLTADSAIPFFNQIGTNSKRIQTIYFKEDISIATKKFKKRRRSTWSWWSLFDILDKFEGARCVYLRHIYLDGVFGVPAARIKKCFASLRSLNVHAVPRVFARDVIHALSDQLESLSISHNWFHDNLDAIFPKLQSLTLTLGLFEITGRFGIDGITTLKDLEVICTSTTCTHSPNLCRLIRNNKQLTKITIVLTKSNFSFAMELAYSVARILKHNWVNMRWTEMVIRFESCESTQYGLLTMNTNKTQVNKIYELLTILQPLKPDVSELTLRIVNIAHWKQDFQSIWKDLTALTKANYDAYAKPPSIIIKRQYRGQPH
eukprot:72363_1